MTDLLRATESERTARNEQGRTANGVPARYSFTRGREQSVKLWGTAPITDFRNDLADCIDNQRRLLHLDGVAAVRVGDVLRVKKVGEAVLSGSPRLPCLCTARAKVESLV